MCCVMGYTGHDLSAAKFKEYLLRTVMRGPDDQRVVEGPFGLMGFGRLAIMGLTPEGMQPFYRGADCVVCNGELYGFRFEKEILKRRGYKFQSDCDCEILLPLYYEYGLDMFRHMDSEFALILYDSRKDRLIAARDPIGIRPLFYGYSKSSHQIAFASEMQNLIGWCDDIRPFPIGSYYCDGRFVRYEDIADVPAPMQDDMDTVLTNIREKLIAGVEKRLDADAPVGFLLSGGLDSSLVCAIAAKKLGKPIRTFAIGMDTDAIDLKYARQTADYLGSEHHEIIINRDIVLQNLEEVIRLLGTWDITTIRASMGMYLLCKAIHEQTDVRVLLTGEISDELFGYKYTDYAPTADAFQQESQKRIRELYMYDVLRADRCISANSIEARVPFGDLDFVRYVMAIDPEMKLNRYNKGKYLLRKAFKGDWLPPEILWREMPWATAWWTTSRSTPTACTPTKSSSCAGPTTRPTACLLPRRACSIGRSSRSITTTRAVPSWISGCPTRHGRAATSTTLPPACWQTTVPPVCDPFSSQQQKKPWQLPWLFCCIHIRIFCAALAIEASRATRRVSSIWPQ
jgi:asparagine synthase (glutamine-hydrolysing)